MTEVLADLPYSETPMCGTCKIPMVPMVVRKNRVSKQDFFFVDA